MISPRLKALLLSGLVFPGLGQLVCGRRRTGALLVLLASGGFFLFLLAAASQATKVAARLEPLLAAGRRVDLAMLLEAVPGPGATIAAIGLLLLCAAWVAGVLHALTLTSR